jgi:hypothetical protein
MRTAGSDEAVCGSLQIEKEIRERLWSRRKKGNAFDDFAIAGTGQVYCVVNSFLMGISFFWAMLLGLHGCASPSGSGNVVVQDSLLLETPERQGSAVVTSPRFC